jgi:transcriptional regulator with GAF, ATPase, and Fis domain
MALMEVLRSEALLMDSWLPDLEAGEFAAQMRLQYPAIDILRVDGSIESGARSPRRNELLHALRESTEQPNLPAIGEAASGNEDSAVQAAPAPRTLAAMPAGARQTGTLLPEMVGESLVMRELARLIKLVAPRSATVLIEGETGTGKEIVARAVHRLSLRAGKPFAVLNCAAIPESLLEAELFGHTRGAFTGAVQSRMGRIEAANGGTLFLDEIGEMPLALQAKMLRFLEYGEIQRVGDNDTMRVDVRIVAATHQPLERRSAERTFRLDLYHRLAVFPLEVPALRDRMDDLELLVQFFLDQMGRDMPRKQMSAEGFALLAAYAWPGNVRELMHVLERAAILVEDRQVIGPAEIILRRRVLH